MVVSTAALIAALLAALAVGAIGGALAGWLIRAAQAKSAEAAFRTATDAATAQLHGQITDLRNQLSARDEDLLVLREQLPDIRQHLGAAQSSVENQQHENARLDRERTELAEKYEHLRLEHEQLNSLLTRARTELDSERRQSSEKLALLVDAKEQLSNQFKTLANDILDEKTKKFTEQNQTSLGQLLDPLKTQIEQFRGKVEEVYVQEGKDRTALATQVQQLMQLNNQLSQDADNLTRALKGDSKAQGNWGEMILERILEISGLRKGIEYTTQTSFQREDNTRAQPDVIINLPEGRNLVIDAKVSLTAYEEYVSAPTDLAREAASVRHVASLRAHLKGLAPRNYQLLYGIQSPDYVVAFVPIEPAYMLAISQEPRLWEEAWQRNILLVSPSSLLFVVRTVEGLWRQQRQTENSQKIAESGAKLYDKLSAFVSELNKVGDALSVARNKYDDALRLLATGRGNVIRQAEILHKLGVKPTKSLPQSVVAMSEADQDANPGLTIPGPAAIQPTTLEAAPEQFELRSLAAESDQTR